MNNGNSGSVKALLIILFAISLQSTCKSSVAGKSEKGITKLTKVEKRDLAAYTAVGIRHLATWGETLQCEHVLIDYSIKSREMGGKKIDLKFKVSEKRVYAYIQELQQYFIFERFFENGLGIPELGVSCEREIAQRLYGPKEGESYYEETDEILYQAQGESKISQITSQSNLQNQIVELVRGEMSEELTEACKKRNELRVMIPVFEVGEPYIAVLVDESDIHKDTEMRGLLIRVYLEPESRELKAEILKRFGLKDEVETVQSKMHMKGFQKVVIECP